MNLWKIFPECNSATFLTKENFESDIVVKSTSTYEHTRMTQEASTLLKNEINQTEPNLILQFLSIIILERGRGYLNLYNGDKQKHK